MPFVGDRIGDFCVEHVSVGHDPIGHGRYEYPLRIVLRGVGGQQGVRSVLASLFRSHPMTFSGYGNPYQLWFGRPSIESLGDRRYAVEIQGLGARVFLEDEIDSFLDHLCEQGRLKDRPDEEARQSILVAYMERYQAAMKRRVGRYRSRLRRAEETP